MRNDSRHVIDNDQASRWKMRASVTQPADSTTVLVQTPLGVSSAET